MKHPHMASATLYLTYISTKYYSIMAKEEGGGKKTQTKNNIEITKIEVMK